MSDRTLDPMVAVLDETLPQLQCGKCGYPDCYTYATALVVDRAAVNRCTPGADWTLRLLRGPQAPPVALDPKSLPHVPARAVIDPEQCIGCARCLPACPTRAILGTRRALHVVLTGDCTGCGLCLAPCPVDCIQLVPVVAPAQPWPGGWRLEDAARARRRYQERQRPAPGIPSEDDHARRQREIAEAVARSRARRAQSTNRSET